MNCNNNRLRQQGQIIFTDGAGRGHIQNLHYRSTVNSSYVLKRQTSSTDEFYFSTMSQHRTEDDNCLWHSNSFQCPFLESIRLCSYLMRKYHAGQIVRRYKFLRFPKAFQNLCFQGGLYGRSRILTIQGDLKSQQVIMFNIHLNQHIKLKD